VIRIKLTNEERNLELIGSVFCEQYQTEAKFYIERSVPLRPGFGTGTRHWSCSMETAIAAARASRLRGEVPARSRGRPVLFDFEDTVAESTVRTGRSSVL
jgi:hypothetical protein